MEHQKFCYISRWAIVKKRRLMFLHYILQEQKTSLIKKFLQTRLQTPTNKDWGSLVLKDMRELNINISIDEIEHMSKRAFKKIVKEQIKKHAFIFSQNKNKKSKSKPVTHEDLDMKKYLAPNDAENSVHAKQFAFKCRARMLNLKYNMKNKDTDIACSACGVEEETLQHVMQCAAINNHREKEEK